MGSYINFHFRDCSLMGYLPSNCDDSYVSTYNAPNEGRHLVRMSHTYISESRLRRIRMIFGVT